MSSAWAGESFYAAALAAALNDAQPLSRRNPPATAEALPQRAVASPRPAGEGRSGARRDRSGSGGRGGLRDGTTKP